LNDKCHIAIYTTSIPSPPQKNLFFNLLKQNTHHARLSSSILRGGVIDSIYPAPIIQMPSLLIIMCLSLLSE